MLANNSIIPKSISKEQARDTGMALVLILLLVEYFFKPGSFFLLAIPVLVINMIIPVIFTPFAWIWFTLTNVLGTVVSKIFLTVLFILFVMPVGTIRKILGKDSLNVKKWKKNASSVFSDRNITFEAGDLENPY